MHGYITHQKWNMLPVGDATFTSKGVRFPRGDHVSWGAERLTPLEHSLPIEVFTLNLVH